MYIVYFGRNRHSAWNTVIEAKKQKEVLVSVGYKNVHVDYDETVRTDNGHYYV